MTRINCVPVVELFDQHLLAEYREITRVSRLARKLPDYGQYKMGAGHVKFFYNKGRYLTNRTEKLYTECVKRGFNVEYKQYKAHPVSLNETWKATEVDLKINRKRLLEKVREKPNFYRYYGKIVYDLKGVEHD